jgi:O-methyltransferase
MATLTARARRVVQGALSRTGHAIVRIDPDAAVPRDMGADFAALYERCRPYTMTSAERMYALHKAARYVTDHSIPGAVVECGVWAGGSSMMAGLSLRDDRRLFLYDTFEGMPEPTERDVGLDGRSAREEWEAKPDWLASSVDEVRANLARVGLSERATLVEGMVEDTIPAEAPDQIALLRLDTDWYESTRHELEHLYPRLVEGGVLIVDDYGHWQGARQAVDEYFGDDPPLLHRVDYTGRVAIKPRRL